MTKHEYIEEYGETNACLCDQCGEYFHPSEAKIEIESHGEEWATCPHCGCDNIHYIDSFDMREEDEEESEEQNNMDDLISREKALKKAYKTPMEDMWHMTEDVEVVEVEDIRKLPSAFEEMTNGEVMKTIFPEVRVERNGFLVRCVFIEHEFTTLETWWDSPYKGVSE